MSGASVSEWLFPCLSWPHTGSALDFPRRFPLARTGEHSKRLMDRGGGAIDAEGQEGGVEEMGQGEELIEVARDVLDRSLVPGRDHLRELVAMLAQHGFGGGEVKAEKRLRIGEGSGLQLPESCSGLSAGAGKDVPLDGRGGGTQDETMARRSTA